MKISHPLILKKTSALVVSLLIFSFHSYAYSLTPSQTTTAGDQSAVVAWAAQIDSNTLQLAIRLYRQNNRGLDQTTSNLLDQVWDLLHQKSLSAQNIKTNSDILQTLYTFQVQQITTWTEQIDSTTLQQLINQYAQTNQQIDSQTQDYLKRLSQALKQRNWSTQDTQQNFTALQILYHLQLQNILTWALQTDRATFQQIGDQYIAKNSQNKHQLDVQTRYNLGLLGKALSNGKLSSDGALENLAALQILYNFEHEQTITPAQPLTPTQPPDPAVLQPIIMSALQTDPTTLLQIMEQYRQNTQNNNPGDTGTQKIWEGLSTALSNGKLSTESAQQNFPALQLLYNFEQGIITWAQQVGADRLAQLQQDYTSYYLESPDETIPKDLAVLIQAVQQRSLSLKNGFLNLTPLQILYQFQQLSTIVEWGLELGPKGLQPLIANYEQKYPNNYQAHSELDNLNGRLGGDYGAPMFSEGDAWANLSALQILYNFEQ